MNLHTGCKFWRSNKKIRALTNDDYRTLHEDEDFQLPPRVMPKRTKLIRYSPISLSSSDNEDFDEPCSSKGKGKKIKKMSRFDSLEERISMLEKLSLSQELSIKDIEYLFKCCICKCVLKRDCFLLQCCGQLSCDGCIRQWFETSKTCPLCRAEDVNDSKPELPRSLLELLDIFSKAEQKDMAGASNAD